jgi:hypothetical protein
MGLAKSQGRCSFIAPATDATWEHDISNELVCIKDLEGGFQFATKGKNYVGQLRYFPPPLFISVGLRYYLNPS